MSHNNDRQRRVEQKAKKASRRRKRERRRRGGGHRLSLGAARGLDEAEELLAEGNFSDAIDVLEELRRCYPRRPEILSLLASAYFESGDQWSYQATCERLTVAAPNELQVWLALGTAALNNNQPAAAHRALTEAAVRWANDPEVQLALELLAPLDAFLAEECRTRGFDVESDFRILLLHDEINLHLHRGNYDQVCDAAARLLTLCPTFAPALNNRSEAHFRSARYSAAIADCRRVLEFDATNYHALGNLTRFLFLSGQNDEAQAVAARFKETVSADADSFVKRAETFAYLADWEAVLDAYRAGQNAWAEIGGTPALVEHLAGVAEANLGNLKAARKHWSRAAKAAHPVEWADENLKDSKRAVGKRHGPWAFPLTDWAPPGLFEEIATVVADEIRDGDVSRRVAEYFERHPQLELLAGLLIERSDANACEMLIRLAPLFNRPAIWAALKKFALGQRGTDALRMQALMTLSHAEVIDGPQELWREGVLTPVALTCQEISCEPTVELPSEIEELVRSANEALNDGQAADAERRLDECLRLRPGDASMQYNRAVAIGLQGREEEALEMVRAIHREHPEYVFARTRLAEECLENGDIDGAKALLAPLSKKPRLHQSEYAAWCSANISLLLAEGQPAAAREMLKAWEQLDPDDRRIKILKSRTKGGRGLLQSFSAMLRKRVE
jgi:Flp pilus assembly protein TadD